MMISVSFDIFRKHTFFGVSLLHVYYFRVSFTLSRFHNILSCAGSYEYINEYNNVDDAIYMYCFSEYNW